MQLTLIISGALTGTTHNTVCLNRLNWQHRADLGCTGVFLMVDTSRNLEDSKTRFHILKGN